MIANRKKSAKDHFNSSAQNYDASRISDWQRFFQRKVIDQMILKENLCVLDVGCGTGWLAIQLHQLVANSKICGIDISEQMINIAKYNSSSLSNIDFKVGDAENIDYPDKTFDYVTCIHSFRHYPNPLIVLKEFSRVLKDGGKLLLLERYADTSFSLWLITSFIHLVAERYNSYCPDSAEILHYLEITNFQDVRFIFKIEKTFYLRKLVTAEVLIEGTVP